MKRFCRKQFARRDHFAPHLNSGFEGYYCRAQLEDGSTIAIILCSVNTAKHRRNYIHCSHTPLDPEPSGSGFKYDMYPEYFGIETQEPASDGSIPFSINVPGYGGIEVSPTTVKLNLKIPGEEIEVRLELLNRIQWSTSTPIEGPMGAYAYLSRIQPLNWHVYSTGSDAYYTIITAGHTRTGNAVAHLEKNWGRSFPAGWIWCQAFESDGRRLCLAGGRALPGVQAYLIGYRSLRLTWDFRPPITAFLGCIGSPWISIQRDSREGWVRLRVRGLRRKLVVNAEAPIDTFVGLSCPLRDGHEPHYAFESFNAQVWVEAWTRRWPWQKWECIEEGLCGGPAAALEFGGSFSHFVEIHQ
ncbi:hypothetical protein CERSUDRAFT_122465 [Gelatoporia subvermispora B]|uniref:Uncharacterized protein n=1 Tax=Ceriporiopsis subvermispora (strain B) TaxID=914234 RepID=M2R357_CERS8|nr:hypothetical protein CERSUDRAFT_122465 [Gelatoporia subvermispora B]